MGSLVQVNTVQVFAVITKGAAAEGYKGRMAGGRGCASKEGGVL